MEKTTIPEAYHTQDEEVRAYRRHLLSQEALEATKDEPPVSNQTEPIFSD